MTKFKILIFTFIISSVVRSQNLCAFTNEEFNTISCINGYVNYKDNINASALISDILLKCNEEFSWDLLIKEEHLKK